MSASALGAAGLVTLFYYRAVVMARIEDGFNQIWRAREGRTLARKFSDYLSAILVGPVLVFAAVTITATLQSSSVVVALFPSTRSARGF